MVRTIVGVLRGGTSSEYGLSLKTGAAMMNALPEDSFETRDILIDKKGMWHHRGTPATPARALSQVDVVLNALHGGVGEDGSVQRILERTGVPFAGARSMQSAIALNKIRARNVLKNAGIRMPVGLSFTLRDGLNTAEMARLVHASAAGPYIVKPPSEGASTGVRFVQTYIELPDALGDVLDMYGSVLVEEFIRGDDATVGVIDGFRNESVYVLPPAHVQREGLHVERHHHDNGTLSHIAPAGFSYIQKQSLMDIAKTAHKTLALSHFSRSDFIVSPRGIYLLEVNTNPGLYPGSSFPVMLGAVGSSVTEFLQHAIQLARSNT
ncbi:MAG: ATP-grasp domain-containing protein [Candidatus Pacebacteria bacterium]|nr:ATP-grasp domain-containing protein [Candidatus Paceibacterota bacterium]